MNSLRLLIVTPRFWPHMGEAEIAAAHLAAELTTCGSHPRILTAQWGRDWPDEMEVQEIPIACVPHAPLGGWSTFRYLRDISRWLRKNPDRYDAVYVMGLRHEAYAAAGALQGSRVPLVLRFTGDGPEGDISWQERSRFGIRIRRRCLHADAIVATSPQAVDELLQAGFDSHRVCQIPLGTVVGSPRTADRRHAARVALAEINHDFAAAEYAPVVVYAGRLEDAKSLTRLVQAWREVGARWPSARLWLLGEGSMRNTLYDEIVNMELKYQVFLSGCFEQLNDVFLAADMFVCPQTHGGSQMILEAMAAGLPVIAADSPERRAMMEHGRSGMLIRPDDQSAWTTTLSQLCDHPAVAAEIGRAAQRAVEQDFSRQRMAQQHLELFESLLRSVPS